MNYQKIYNDLISRAQAREPLSEYKETHHIIPRCMGGSDDKENLVELTAREHFIAHAILSKIYPVKSVIFAFFMMCNMKGTKKRHYKVHSKIYAHAKKLNSQFRKGTVISEETRLKMSKAKTGLRLTEETKHKISAATKGRAKSEETKKKMRKPKTEEAKKNIAAAKVSVLNPMYGTISPTRDVPHTKETRDLISLRTKQGAEYPPCPHCGKKVNKGNALRWHYDKCKFKDSK